MRLPGRGAAARFRPFGLALCLAAGAVLAMGAPGQVPAALAPKPTPTPTAPAKSNAPVSDADMEFCGLVVKCGLTPPAGSCPEPASRGVPKVDYDSARCAEARTLNGRGVTPSTPYVGYRLYRFLGQRYRIIYTVEEDIPISDARLAYLLNDLPLSARLVSYFRKEAYTAEYLDFERRWFKGTKGTHLKGEARLISGSTTERKLYYFGTGIAEVAWWRLRGPALMDFEYAPKPGDPRTLHYRMKVVVFPGNGMVNGIMNLGLFKKVVYGKIREVLEDITASAKALAAGGEAAVRKEKSWTPEERKKIEDFLKLP